MLQATSAPMALEPMLLSVRHLRREYRPRDRTAALVVANDDLNLEVRSGEIVALLGPNGAGKSTLLKQLSGQLEPTSGAIDVAGVDMVADPQHAKRFLSAVPQESQPLENLSVEEHVRYFGLIKGLDRRRTEEEVSRILGLVGLTGQRTKPGRELSGGYKRRVLIAIALASPDARLLLLDEPTTGLDPAARRAVWTVIESLRSERKGIVLTTHYIEEAEYLADRVVIIDHGRFILSGTVEEIRRHVPYRGRLDVHEPGRLKTEQRAALTSLEGRWPLALERPNLLRFHVDDPFAAGTIAELGHLTALGIRASLSPVSLEDVYLSVVGASEEEP